MYQNPLNGLAQAAQNNAFEAAARQVLERLRPRIDGDGANRFAIPSHWSRSTTGLPVRIYRNPRTGAAMVFGVDRAAWLSQGIVRVIRLG
jgi:hypothetical protein